MPPSASRPLATVDAETMQRIPWVDFNVVLDNTEKYNREQVIFDILQANMPNSGDNIYYVYQDPETNVEKQTKLTKLLKKFKTLLKIFE